MRPTTMTAARGLALASLTLPLAILTAQPGAAAPYDTGTTSRVSVRTGGSQTTAKPYALSMSTSGRYVAFMSTDPKLVANDRNGTQPDLFVHDRVAKTVRLVSIDENGQQTPPDDGETSPLAVVDGGVISADGTKVAYTINDGINSQHGSVSPYVRDLSTGEVTAIPDGGNGAGVIISANGRYVAVTTSSDYAESTYINVFDTSTGTLSPAWAGSNEDPTFAAGISNDGRYVLIAKISAYDHSPIGVYRTDRKAGTTVSVATAGGNPVMTPDGRYIAWDSKATFGTPDTNKTSDVFRKDMTTRQIIRVSLTSTGGQGNNASYPQGISDNGDRIAFTSAASNLVPKDTNGKVDVFVRQVAAKLTRRVSVSTSGVQSNGGASSPVMSGDGKHILFLAAATNLVSGDTNKVVDAFVRETAAPS